MPLRIWKRHTPGSPTFDIVQSRVWMPVIIEPMIDTKSVRLPASKPDWAGVHAGGGTEAGGCGCRVGGTRETPLALWLGVLALVALVRRRR